MKNARREQQAGYSVTILILIDGFLQYDAVLADSDLLIGHNPYFNRWFSAMRYLVILKYYDNLRHNPYFNRWFSAM